MSASSTQLESNPYAVLNAIGDQCAVVDAAGCVIWVNEAWRRCAEEIGYPAESMIGTNYIAVCLHAAADGHDDVEAIGTGLADILAGRTDRFIRSYRCAVPDRQRLYEVEIAPTNTADGLGALVLHRDITLTTAAKSDRHQGRLLQQSLDGIIVIAENGVVRDANPAAIEILGYPDLIGMAVHEVNVDHDQARVLARIQEIREAGSSRFVTHHRHADGRILDIEVSAHYVRTAHDAMIFAYLRRVPAAPLPGLPQAPVVALLEAAGRVLAAETIQEALERMAAAVHQSGWDAVVSCIYDGWQRTHLAIVGLSEDEVEIANRHQPTPEQRAEMYGEMFAPYRVGRSYFLRAEELAELQATHGERPLVPGRSSVEGEEAWDVGDVAYVPLYARDNEILGAISLDRPRNGHRPTRETFEHLEFFADLAARTIEHLRSMTELKRITAELREREARLRVVYDQIPALLWTVDLDQRITAMLGLQLDRVGMTPSDFEGRSIEETARAGGSDLPIDMHSRALRGESVNYVYAWNDATYKVHLEPLRDTDHQIIGAVGIGLDITDIQQTQAELEQRSAREALLLRELDHRVRNNLSSLITLVDMTRRKRDDLDEFASVIRGRIAAMATVHTLLVHSRWSSTDLERLLRGLIPPDLHAQVSITGEPVDIPASQITAMAMALHELLTNSAKYGAMSSIEGQLEVSWTIADDVIELTWLETGGGTSGVVTPGTGTRLIEGLVKSDLQGRATFRYLPDGVRHSITMKRVSEQPFGHDDTTIA